MARRSKCEELARLQQEEANAVMQLGIELMRLYNDHEESGTHAAELLERVEVARSGHSRTNAALESHIARHQCAKIVRR